MSSDSTDSTMFDAILDSLSRLTRHCFTFASNQANLSSRLHSSASETKLNGGSCSALSWLRVDSLPGRPDTRQSGSTVEGVARKVAQKQKQHQSVNPLDSQTTATTIRRHLSRPRDTQIVDLITIPIESTSKSHYESHVMMRYHGITLNILYICCFFYYALISDCK